MQTWIELLPTRLSIDAVSAFLTDPGCGGINLFLGTTRAEVAADGRQLLALEYEAYPEMALARLHQLATQASQTWPVQKLAILHRLGQVGIGQASVIIGVACPHRAETFQACQWLIDHLKIDVPIWKKEIWDDGTGSWVHH